MSQQTAMSAVSIFFASLGVSLLSLARDTYTQEQRPKKLTDDVATALWFISVFYAVIAAVLGGVTDKLAGVTMSLAFLGLLVGGFVFVWAEHSTAVALSLTIAVGLIFAAFVATAVVTPQNHP